MSKDLQNNERYLKELADKHKPVPPPLVWDEIEKVLDKDKDKRRSFPILWIFGVLLLGMLMFINLRGNNDKALPLSDQVKSTSDYQTQSGPSPSHIRTIDSESINELNQGRHTNISETNRGEYQKQHDPSPSHIRTIDSEDDHELDQEQNANISETLLSVSVDQEGKKVDFEKMESFETRQNQSIQRNKYAVGSTLKINTTNSDVTTIITKEDNFRPRIFNQSTESSFEDRHIIQVTALERMTWVRKPFETTIPLPYPSKNLTFVPSPASIRKTSFTTPWFIELGVGIGKNLSNPVLIDTTQGEFRLDTESRWYSWSTSFQVGYQFDNLWYATIGFDLNQTKNRFDFWRRDVSSLIVDESQSLQITNSDFFNIGEIRYTFADFGLSVGRRVNIDKWHFSLEGGPIFNVLFKANGKVQVGVLEFSRFELQEDYFNTQIGIGARLSAMLDYPISDEMWISVGPIYHKYFNAVSSDENPLEERNAILQIKARVRYHF